MSIAIMFPSSCSIRKLYPSRTENSLSSFKWSLIKIIGKRSSPCHGCLLPNRALPHGCPTSMCPLSHTLSFTWSMCYRRQWVHEEGMTKWQGTVWNWVPYLRIGEVKCRPDRGSLRQALFDSITDIRAYPRIVHSGAFWYTTECTFSTFGVVQLNRMTASYPSGDRT